MKAGIYAASILRNRCDELGLLTSQVTASREAVAEGDFEFFSKLLQASRDRGQSLDGHRDDMLESALNHAATDDR